MDIGRVQCLIVQLAEQRKLGLVLAIFLRFFEFILLDMCCQSWRWTGLVVERILPESVVPGQPNGK